MDDNVRSLLHAIYYRTNIGFLPKGEARQAFQAGYTAMNEGTYQVAYHNWSIALHHAANTNDAKHAQVYALRALAQLQLRDGYKAKEDVHVALALRPTDGNYLVLLGLIHMHNKDPNWAKRRFEEALHHSPSAAIDVRKLAAEAEAAANKRNEEIMEKVAAVGLKVAIHIFTQGRGAGN